MNIPKKFLPTRQKAQTVSGGKKTTPVVGEVVTKPQKPSIIEDWSGVTQDLKQRVQNNAYVQEYAKPMLEEIDRDGVPSNKDEYINRHLETKLQEIAEGLEEQKNLIKNEGGKVYKQIRETNVPIEL
ncbi:MAG: hypothetical protein Q4B28_05195 [bacterium]|nr:hypothetical protein [bacterium]